MYCFVDANLNPGPVGPPFRPALAPEAPGGVRPGTCIGQRKTGSRMNLISTGQTGQSCPERMPRSRLCDSGGEEATAMLCSSGADGGSGAAPALRRRQGGLAGKLGRPASRFH